ncbi:hypothetical protein ACYATP_00040 [Lactobacillaceae bacterium Melli_B4]
MSNLEKLGQKESIKQMGASPFAKKQNQNVNQVTTKISRDKHNLLKRVALDNDMTLYQMLDKMIDDGIEKYKK